MSRLPNARPLKAALVAAAAAAAKYELLPPWQVLPPLQLLNGMRHRLRRQQPVPHALLLPLHLSLLGSPVSSS